MINCFDFNKIRRYFSTFRFNQKPNYKTKSSTKVKRYYVTPMRVLLTNDDGIYAQGLWALYKKFAAKHQVTVIAPDRERSAVGQSITLHEPLRAKRVVLNGGEAGYAVNGTPADCIKLGIQEIVPNRPDVVISGINKGANVGININYSGTVGAAREASLCGIAALAVSIQAFEIEDYDGAAAFVYFLVKIVHKKGLPFGTILNVNLPNKPLNDLGGVRISRQGIGPVPENLEKRIDPRNLAYYWQGCDKQNSFDDPDIDGVALDQNYISITPIQSDMTDYPMIDKLKTWGIEKSG
jgi:5'-nucleotidase